ncbi:hypothetical protein AX16_004659 [Volvariella volvacea WC 439]|nr:hypothetical protein AX16_004659 [Volvariella volvacea WC 439]
MSLFNRVRATLAKPSPQATTPIRESLKIVRGIIASHPTIATNGLTTHELYKLALKEQPSKDFVPDEELVSASKKAAAAAAAAASALARGGIRPPKKKGAQQQEVLPGFGPLPPHPEHPIRSMKFLKHSILPVLEGNKEIKTVRITRPLNAPAPASTSTPAQASSTSAKGKAKTAQGNTTSAKAAAPSSVTVWAWKPIDKSTLSAPPKPKPFKEPFGKDVGVGEDWSHLNRRRQHSRMDKLRRDVWLMKELQPEKRRRANMVKRAAAEKRTNRWEAAKLRLQAKQAAKEATA